MEKGYSTLMKVAIQTPEIHTYSYHHREEKLINASRPLEDIRLFLVISRYLDSCVLSNIVTNHPFLSNGCVCQSQLWICPQHWHQQTASRHEQCRSQPPNLAMNLGSVSLCNIFLFSLSTVEHQWLKCKRWPQICCAPFYPLK